MTLVDVAGPAEAFTVTVDGAVSGEAAADTYLVPGSDRYPRAPVTRSLAEAARVPAAAARRIASICTGAFVLAAAGLLDGKRATTHWRVTHELAARCPTCRVQPDAIDVRDGDTYTSAGVTAGIDLALALVEKVRFDMSRALLDQGHTATDAAALAGFPSYESMRRVFARELSISPAAYRRRFRTARLPSAG